MKSILFVALSLWVTVPVLANDTKTADEAVGDTSTKLKNANSRKNLINQSESAKRADQTVTDTVGAKNSDEVYDISADILPTLFKDKSPEEVTALLQKAQGNPAEFYKSLPPDIQKRIHELSKKSDHHPASTPDGE